MVDIARDPAILRRRRRWRIAAGAALMLVVAAVSVVLSRMKPASPTVEMATVLVDEVKRGTIVRQVRGLGSLVPEDTRWIPATTDGRVERILLRPGAVVKPDSVILELSSPSVEQEALVSRLSVQSAEATLISLRVQNESTLLSQQAQVASLEADFSQAEMQLKADAELAREKLLSQLNLRKSEVALDLLRTRLGIERKRLASVTEALDASLRVQQAAVEQARGAAALSARRLASLRVTPGFSGVLQVVGVEVGEQVGPGKNVARVADPSRLKAQLKVLETQARDIEIGQSADVDTRNGVVKGVVSRKDPAAANGTVTVDVTFIEALPRGAVPELSVDGTIQLERLENILYVQRPALGQEQSTVGLFRIVNASGDAQRVQVKLGRGSVNAIEVKSGLEEHDRVVLSDMSSWDAYDTVRLR
jgi:HlyD family secretion protein